MESAVASQPKESKRAACLERRRQAVREEMRRSGLDLVIAYGSGAHTFLGSNPAWYLSGFKQMGPHAAVVLPADGEPLLIMTPLWDLARAAERSPIEDIVAVDPEEFVPALDEELRKRDLKTKRIGVAGGQHQLRAISEGFAEMLGRPPTSADKLISDIARIRDDWSLACTRRAVGIAERGYERLLGMARPGMQEYEVAAELDVYMRELGAEDNFQLMSASQHNRSVHQPTSRILARGDVLLAEITPAVEGEFIQICRTIVFGAPSALQHEKFAMLDDALRAGLSAAQPGVPVSDVVAAINKPIEAAGYAQFTRAPYMRTRGHSMALGSMDPEIAIDSGHVLRKNMVFVMHPNQYIPETGYMMCGEPVIITDDGAQPLTSRMGTLDSIAC
ncbi:MAG TPA: Xaa-Pro peptidase family protein [Beijerinckiaceae bacterium]|nr:Xaa-Pro peptidase family protein [Beijerinckiaceae bacterium]